MSAHLKISLFLCVQLQWICEKGLSVGHCRITTLGNPSVGKQQIICVTVLEEKVLGSWIGSVLKATIRQVLFFGLCCCLISNLLC